MNNIKIKVEIEGIEDPPVVMKCARFLLVQWVKEDDGKSESLKVNCSHMPYDLMAEATLETMAKMLAESPDAGSQLVGTTAMKNLDTARTVASEIRQKQGLGPKT